MELLARGTAGLGRFEWQLAVLCESVAVLALLGAYGAAGSWSRWPEVLRVASGGSL